MPYYPSDNDLKIDYILETTEAKMIADYCNISIMEVEELEIIDYWLFLREAFIVAKAQTEEGRQWLHNAFRISQTEPERKKLREKYGAK